MELARGRVDVVPLSQKPISVKQYFLRGKRFFNLISPRLWHFLAPALRRMSWHSIWVVSAAKVRSHCSNSCETSESVVVCNFTVPRACRKNSRRDLCRISNKWRLGIFITTAINVWELIYKRKAFSQPFTCGIFELVRFTLRNIVGAMKNGSGKVSANIWRRPFVERHHNNRELTSTIKICIRSLTSDKREALLLWWWNLPIVDSSSGRRESGEEKIRDMLVVNSTLS